MKIKSSELTGIALDWAVATCEGMDYFYPDIGPAEPAYSSDWSIGGPIIERERITVHYDNPDNTWIAWHAADLNATRAESGETPLIAAMRCYVANKLGNEVEILDCLVRKQ